MNSSKARRGVTPGHVLELARSGDPGRAYLFFGPERYLLRLVLERMSACLPEDFRSFNCRFVEGGSGSPASDLLSWAYSPPMGARWRLLVTTDEDLLATGRGTRRREDEQAYLRYLSEPSASCCLILVGGATVDGRGRLYQAFAKSSAVVHFEQLDARELRRWAVREAGRTGKTIKPDVLSYLVTASAGDLGFLMGSVEKACLYTGDEQEISLSIVQEVVSSTPQGSIFNLMDAVGERDAGKALTYLRRLLLMGEPPVKVGFMLTRQMRYILQAKLMAAEGLKASQVASELQVRPFVADKLMAQARGYSLPLLEIALNRMQNTDKMLKGSGRDPQAILEETILFLCRPNA